MVVCSCLPVRPESTASTPHHPLPFRRPRGEAPKPCPGAQAEDPLRLCWPALLFQPSCRVPSPLGTALKQSAPGTVPTLGAGPGAGMCAMMSLHLFLTVCLLLQVQRAWLFFSTPSFNPFVDEYIGFLVAQRICLPLRETQVQSGRSLGEGNDYLSIFTWRIPWRFWRATVLGIAKELWTATWRLSSSSSLPIL